MHCRSWCTNTSQTLLSFGSSSLTCVHLEQGWCYLFLSPRWIVPICGHEWNVLEPGEVCTHTLYSKYDNHIVMKDIEVSSFTVYFKCFKLPHKSVGKQTNRQAFCHIITFPAQLSVIRKLDSTIKLLHIRCRKTTFGSRSLMQLHKTLTATINETLAQSDGTSNESVVLFLTISSSSDA